MRHKLILIGIIGLILASVTVLADPIGPNADKDCINNHCKLTIYGYEKNTQYNQQYTDFATITNAKWDNQALNFSYINGDYWVLIRPTIGFNGNEYTMGQVKTLAPNVEITAYKRSEEGVHKYGVFFEGLTQQQQQGIQYIRLQLVDSHGLQWDDVKRDGTALIIKNKVKLDFGDLIDSGYTLQLQDNRNLIISNIQANIKDNSFDIDPTISLNSSYIIYDGLWGDDGGGDHYGIMRWNLSDYIDDIAGIDTALMEVTPVSVPYSTDGDFTTCLIKNQTWDDTWTYTQLEALTEYNCTTHDDLINESTADSPWNVTITETMDQWVQDRDADGLTYFDFKSYDPDNWHTDANNWQNFGASSVYIAGENRGGYSFRIYSSEDTTPSRTPKFYIEYTSKGNATTIQAISPDNGNYPLNVTIDFTVRVNSTLQTSGVTMLNATIGSNTCTLQGSASYVTDHWEQNCSIPDLTTGQSYTLEICTNTSQGSITCDNEASYFTYNSVYTVVVYDPTTESPDTVTAGDDVTIQFYLNKDGVNVTDLTKDDVTITIGGLAAPIVSSESGPQATQYTDGFESGTINGNWTVYGSNGYARLTARTTAPNTGSYSAVADSTTNGQYALNELITALDFTGTTYINVSYSAREFGDEANTPSDHTGHQNSEGFFYSCDGNQWYLIQSFTGLTSTYADFSHELAADADWCGTGNSSLKLKWTQYDNYAVSTDGISWDDITIDYVADVTQYDFACTAGLCTINVTSNDTLSGLEDTLVNITYDAASRTGTETENFNFGAITGNCTCSGIGVNKEYHYGLNCDITTDCNMTGGNITWTGGSGTWTCHANIYACNMAEPTKSNYIGGNCSIYLSNC